MKRFTTTLIAMLLLGVAVQARAFVPQTINVDGVNDFDPANLLKDDRSDTQPNCTPAALPLDLGRVYMTNDANYLYIGIEFAQTCFCSMNLGMAFNTTGGTGGGTSDPFGRDIGWASIATKPNWIIYDVTPTSCNTFNYEILYRDTTVAAVHSWLNRSAFINPAWGGGANGLGIIDSLNFKELKIPLSVFGLTTGNTLNAEFWVTQEGTTKGPLDALASDDVQMSHPNTTTFDTSAVVQMTHMLAYTVLNYVDTQPPTVSKAEAMGFTVLANRQVQLSSNKIDLTFSEPVDQTTSQVPGNYVYSGPSARSVISALRDAVTPSVVHLTLNAAVAASAVAHAITVTGVKDAALTPNTIVANGTTNVGSFYLQNVTFNGDFRLGLCNGNFAAADTFAVEGSLSPLTFTLCDNVLLTDANTDSIYTATVPFCIPHYVGATRDTLHLEWKFSHKCVDFEPFAGNRGYRIDAANGATATVSAAWNNDDPSNFTSHAVDVIFQVDAAHFFPAVSPILTLLGNTTPLHFTQPGTTLYDDGTHGDLVAGDKIYTVRVTFPSCSPKSVDWKVDFNGTIECLGQNNRNVYLNDALYSSATPITLPARGIDRCTVTDKPLTVVFKVNMSPINPLPSSADTVVVKGSALPLTWGWPAASAAVMADNGVGDDTRSHDGVFTKSVTFPDSTAFAVSFKYDFKWAGATTDSLECAGYPDRWLVLDDVVMSSGTPIVRLVNPFNYCSDPTAVLPTVMPHAGTAFGALRQVMPNPIARHANFSFELYRTGHVTFSLYDVTGRRVARLVNATLPAGVHSVSWDGVSDGGMRLASGVYMYEVAMGADRLSRRMILVH